MTRLRCHRNLIIMDSVILTVALLAVTAMAAAHLGSVLALVRQ